MTHSRLNSISFEKEDILKIIRNLNVNKAHGHDDISIRMLKNMILKWLNRYHLFIKIAYILEFSLIYGRGLISFENIKT